MFDPSRSAVEHVARREARRSIATGREAMEGLLAFVLAAVEPAMTRFSRGERLTGPDMRAACALVENGLSGSLVAPLARTDRPATRTRPKGESFEIRALLRCAAGGEEPLFEVDGRGDQAGMVSLRLGISRRKLTLDIRGAGVVATRHLLERAIERDLAAWRGRFDEVETAMLDGYGLAMAWRHAVAARLLPTTRFALPLADGLMVGTFSELPGDDCGAMVYEVSRHGVASGGDGEPVRPGCPDPLGNRWVGTCKTALDWSRLNRGRTQLHASLERFTTGNAEALRDLSARFLWPGGDMESCASLDEVARGLPALAAELAGRLSDPVVAAVLRDASEAVPNGYGGATLPDGAAAA